MHNIIYSTYLRQLLSELPWWSIIRFYDISLEHPSEIEYQSVRELGGQGYRTSRFGTCVDQNKPLALHSTVECTLRSCIRVFCYLCITSIRFGKCSIKFPINIICHGHFNPLNTVKLLNGLIMFGGLWNFVKRHRRKFIFTGVVLGGK